MNGVHDMGGMHGFGRVDTDDDGPFHDEWEVEFHATSRVLGVHGLYSADENRHMRERLSPAEYLRADYYEQRLLPMEWLLVENGVLSPGDVDARIQEGIPDVEGTDPDLAERVRETLAANSSFELPGDDPAFDVGDRVFVKNRHPDGHTRCPRYVRRAEGVVDACHGTQRFPDASAEGEDVGHPLYSVRFTAREVWGDDRPASDTLVLQLWEPYLRAR